VSTDPTRQSGAGLSPGEPSGAQALEQPPCPSALAAKHMLTCRECSDFLMHYLEGELPPAQAEAFRRHLALCPPCEQYVLSYKSTVAACTKAAGDRPAAMPEALVTAIMSSLRGRGPGPGSGCSKI
jgi:hypothetical protein